MAVTQQQHEDSAQLRSSTNTKTFMYGMARVRRLLDVIGATDYNDILVAGSEPPLGRPSKEYNAQIDPVTARMLLTDCTFPLWQVLRNAYRQCLVSTAELAMSEQSAQAGLGIWLQAAFNSFRTPLIFAAAIVIVAETGILLGAISLLEWAFLGEDDTVADNSEGD